MDSKQLKKTLAGLSVATLLAGAFLTSPATAASGWGGQGGAGSTTDKKPATQTGWSGQGGAGGAAEKKAPAQSGWGGQGGAGSTTDKKSPEKNGSDEKKPGNQSSW